MSRSSSIRVHRRRVTIADVARRAGVSAGTVSAVLNGKGGVRERTRGRVLLAIDELDYQPLPSARALAARDAARAGDRSVGLVVKEAANPFYLDVVAGARAFLAEQGFVLFVTSSEGDYEMEGRLIELLRAKQMAGAIIGPVVHGEVDLGHLFQLRHRRFPFVLLEHVQGLRSPVVSVDNVLAAKRVMHHLFELGHERVVHLAGPLYTPHTRDRIDGVRLSFSESSLCFHDAVVVPAGASIASGRRAAQALFEQTAPAERPTALCCFNDLVAIGAMQALQAMGLDVPGQVSVTGFDDIPAAAFFGLPLTTVHVPRHEIGRRAAELLLQRLAGDDGPPPHACLQAELRVRATTARPPQS